MYPVICADMQHKEIGGQNFKKVDLKVEYDDLQDQLMQNHDTGSVKPVHGKIPTSLASTSTNLPSKQAPVNTKSETVGHKRSASSWRETRLHQEPGGGADPHDDFLNTPMERARNLNAAPREEVQDLPVLAPNDMDFSNSDDETQEVTNTNAVPQKQSISVLGPAVNKGFKYVEPVRKKSERENLQGIECKQCKKFYDAVLPDDNGANNANKTMRCEHHDGVSRHRYRYAPPMTPEGFWNIGFESEL